VVLKNLKIVVSGLAELGRSKHHWEARQYTLQTPAAAAAAPIPGVTREELGLENETDRVNRSIETDAAARDLFLTCFFNITRKLVAGTPDPPHITETPSSCVSSKLIGRLTTGTNRVSDDLCARSRESPLGAH